MHKVRGKGNGLSRPELHFGIWVRGAQGGLTPVHVLAELIKSR